MAGEPYTVLDLICGTLKHFGRVPCHTTINSVGFYEDLIEFKRMCRSGFCSLCLAAANHLKFTICGSYIQSYQFGFFKFKFGKSGFLRNNLA